MMREEREIEEMADQAKLQSGFDGEGFVSFGGVAGEQDLDFDEIKDRRTYAEGVEAGLRWVIRWAGEPFPR